MKIKGVVRTKKNYGDIIEYSAEEKVPLALKDAVTTYPDFEDKHLTYTRSINLSTVTSSQKGELLKKMWQNNIYYAKGTAVLHRRSLRQGREGSFPMLQPLSVSFEIEFEDKLDNIGQPDLKVNKLVLKKQ